MNRNSYHAFIFVRWLFPIFSLFLIRLFYVIIIRWVIILKYFIIFLLLNFGLFDPNILFVLSIHCFRSITGIFIYSFQSFWTISFFQLVDSFSSIGRLSFFEWKYFVVIRRTCFSGNILLSLNVASFGFVIILHQWYRECWYLIFPFVPFVHFIFDCDGYSSSTEIFPSNILLCFQDSVKLLFFSFGVVISVLSIRYSFPYI